MLLIQKVNIHFFYLHKLFIFEKTNSRLSRAAVDTQLVGNLPLRCFTFSRLAFTLKQLKVKLGKCGNNESILYN